MALPTATKRSFYVPKSLPDSVHKRKLETIKRRLDHNSDVKRRYKRTLKHMGLSDKSDLSAGSAGAADISEINVESLRHSQDLDEQDSSSIRLTKDKKKSRFSKEEGLALRIQTERAAKQRARELRNIERTEKIELRKKYRSKMTKHTQRGQPKLGPKIDVLLDKIQRRN
ncbi:uncharacterized protein V1516DRAFT_670091 [Lipomyces oligophaga]|uniref:uncharacterized protein n=1 Tax=Lipomyces oligophaga TaxID=45792 RepID=UPI0034CF1F3E